jgi:hypothetical protein
VQLTHILPSAVWALAIPIQLYPDMRKAYPRLHRWSGYAFALAAAFMMYGLYVMHIRGLYYFKTDFPELGEHLHMTRFPAVLGWVPHVEVFLSLGVWFTVSLLYSVQCARKKRFQSHRYFIYRHVASGLWVAVQRLYVGLGAVIGPTNSQAQKQNFGDGAVFGAAFCLVLAELAVWRSRNLKTARQKKE